MDIATFEQRVFNVDGILIRIRAQSSQHVGDYAYTRAASGTTTISEWLKTRIYPLIGNLECDVITGDYGPAHGLKQLDTVRRTY